MPRTRRTRVTALAVTATLLTAGLAAPAAPSSRRRAPCLLESSPNCRTGTPGPAASPRPAGSAVPPAA